MDRDKVKFLQDTQLDILMYVHDLCKELNISYMLMFGSLIGVLRHGGPIPWDIDIDIAMFRDDYEKLRSYFVNDNNKKYFYSDYTTNKFHVAPHAVLVDRNSHIKYKDNKSSRKKYISKYDGIYIDIFPIDRTTADKKLRDKQSNDLMFVRRVIERKRAVVYKGKTGKVAALLKYLLSFLLSPLTFRFLGKQVNKIQLRYSQCDDDCYVISTDNVCFGEAAPIDMFLPLREAQYSGKQVYIPAKTEEMLSSHYKNYMEYPPEDERWSLIDDHFCDVEFDH